MVKITIQLPHFPSDFFIKMYFGNGISNTLNFKIFWGGIPPDPLCFGDRYVLEVRTKSHASPLSNDLIKVPKVFLLSTQRKTETTSTDGKHFKQLHETAMGSSVSIVVTEVVMQKSRGTRPSNDLSGYVTLTISRQYATA